MTYDFRRGASTAVLPLDLDEARNWIHTQRSRIRDAHPHEPPPVNGPRGLGWKDEPNYSIDERKRLAALEHAERWLIQYIKEIREYKRNPEDVANRRQNAELWAKYALSKKLPKRTPKPFPQMRWVDDYPT